MHRQTRASRMFALAFMCLFLSSTLWLVHLVHDRASVTPKYASVAHKPIFEMHVPVISSSSDRFDADNNDMDENDASHSPTTSQQNDDTFNVAKQLDEQKENAGGDLTTENEMPSTPTQVGLSTADIKRAVDALWKRDTERPIIRQSPKELPPIPVRRQYTKTMDSLNLRALLLQESQAVTLRHQLAREHTKLIHLGSISFRSILPDTVLESIHMSASAAVANQDDGTFQLDFGGGEERLWRFEHKGSSINHIPKMSEFGDGGNGQHLGASKRIQHDLDTKSVANEGEEKEEMYKSRSVLKGDACWESVSITVQPLPPDVKTRYFAIHDSVPRIQQELWRRALFADTVRQWKELVPSSPTWASDPSLRFVVLPWSDIALNKATWKAVMNILEQNPRVLVTRIPIADGEAVLGHYNNSGEASATMLPILTGQDMQHTILYKYARTHGCTLADIGIQPPTFAAASDPVQCADFSSQMQGQSWLVKHRTQIQVFPTLDALKVQVGPCESERESSSFVQRNAHVVYQRALVKPLLVHDRRIKLHAFMLVASTSPLTVFVFNKALVTLASPQARTTSTGPTGATVSTTTQLKRESTEFGTQRANGLLGPDESGSVWSLARLARYLESFGLCTNADICGQQLRKQINKVCRVGLDISTNHLHANHVSGTFSLMHVRMWVNEDLQVMWHRTTAAVHELLSEQHADVSELGLEMLGSAVRLVERVQSESGFLRQFSDQKAAVSDDGWELLHSTANEICDSDKTKFNPCESELNKHATDGEGAAKTRSDAGHISEHTQGFNKPFSSGRGKEPQRHAMRSLVTIGLNTVLTNKAITRGRVVYDQIHRLSGPAKSINLDMSRRDQ